MKFLFMRGAKPSDSVFRRVDFKERVMFIDMGSGRPGVMTQAVGFSHASWGDHDVYVDRSELDAAGIPKPEIYETIGVLLKRAVA